MIGVGVRPFDRMCALLQRFPPCKKVVFWKNALYEVLILSQQYVGWCHYLKFYHMLQLPSRISGANQNIVTYHHVACINLHENVVKSERKISSWYADRFKDLTLYETSGFESWFFICLFLPRFSFLRSIPVKSQISFLVTSWIPELSWLLSRVLYF